VAVRLVYLNYEDKTGLPNQIVMSADRAAAAATSLAGVPVFAPGPVAEGVPAIVHQVLRSPGQPLDQSSREFFEPRFGRDFSQVRVHADENAAKSAKATASVEHTALEVRRP